MGLEWTEIAKIAVGVAGIAIPTVLAVCGAAFRWWGSRLWAPRDQVRKIIAAQRELKEMAHQNEDRVDRLEQEQAHRSELLQQQVIRPLTHISERVGEISQAQNEQAIGQSRLEEAMKGIGRSLDDLRARMERQEQKA